MKQKLQFDLPSEKHSISFSNESQMIYYFVAFAISWFVGGVLLWTCFFQPTIAR